MPGLSTRRPFLGESPETTFNSRLLFRLIDAEPADWIAFSIAVVVQYGLARFLCRENEETFESYWLLFVVAPIAFGLVGVTNGSHFAGVAVAALITIFTTTFFGDLSLQSSLFLALAGSSTVG